MFHCRCLGLLCLSLLMSCHPSPQAGVAVDIFGVWLTELELGGAFRWGLVGCGYVGQGHSIDTPWLAVQWRNAFREYPPAHGGDLCGTVKRRGRCQRLGCETSLSHGAGTSRR